MSYGNDLVGEIITKLAILMVKGAYDLRKKETKKHVQLWKNTKQVQYAVIFFSYITFEIATFNSLKLLSASDVGGVSYYFILKVFASVKTLGRLNKISTIDLAQLGNVGLKGKSIIFFTV